MSHNFIFYLFLTILIFPKSNSYNVTLKIIAKDYIKGIYLNNIPLIKYNNYINQTSLSFSMNYDEIIRIDILNIFGNYGLSASLEFNNGNKKEIYSTNEYWLWKNNDTRYNNNYPYMEDSNLYGFTNAKLIGGINRNDSHFLSKIYSYELSIIRSIKCINQQFGYIHNNILEILLKDYIKTKIKNINDIIFKIKNEFKGIIYDENNNKIIKGNEYKINKLIYSTEYYNSLDIIKYSLKYNSTTVNCEFKIYTCSQICKSCNIDNLNNIICNIPCEKGKYFNGNECVNIPEKKYYNSTNNKIENCYISCYSCSQYGNEKENNCNSCDNNNGYYIIENNNQNTSINCYKNPEGYFLDEINKKYIPCGKNCKLCKYNKGIITCISYIKKNYFLKNDKTKILKNKLVYFINKKRNLIQCYETCKNCIEEGTKTDSKCTECSDLAYPLEDDSSKCYFEDDIPENYFLDKTNKKISKCYQTCKTCTGKGNNMDNKCIECKNNYYHPKTNLKLCKELLYNEYVNDDDPNNVYSDRCSNDCYNCYKGHDHTNNKSNCYICRGEKYSLNGECIKNCSSEYKIIDNSNERSCVKNCEDRQFYQIKGTNECINDCVANNYYYENSYCVDSCSDDYILENNVCVKKKNNFSNSNLDEAIKILPDVIVDLETNKMINGKGYSVEIINTNEDYQMKYNLSMIDIKECEQILKKQYNIKEEDNLLIGKFDIPNKDKNSLTGAVRIFVFDSKGNELDLKYCQNVKIDIQYPINNENINLTYGEYMNNLNVDVFNSQDEYFNNLCKVSVGNNTDITISKRRDDQYINVTICEKGCEYKGINYTIMKANCECSLRNNLLPITDTLKTQIENVFSKSIPKTNIYIAKCYKIFFGFKKIFINIGFWFFSSLIIIDLFLYLYYSIYGLNNSVKILYSILLENAKKISNPPKKRNILSNSSESVILGKNDEIKFENKTYTTDKEKETTILKCATTDRSNLSRSNKLKNISINIKSNIDSSPRKTKNYLHSETLPIKNNDISPLTLNNFDDDFPNIKRLKKIKFNGKKFFYITNSHHSNHDKKFSEENLLSYIGNNGIIKKTKLKYQSTTEIMEYIHGKDNLFFIDDDGINNATFTKAKNEDNRTLNKMLFDFFIENQNFIQVFIKQSKYEIICIKIILYIIDLSINFWLNAIFYTDSVVEEKYDNNKISFITEFLKSFYSCLVGVIFSFIFNRLSVYCNYFEILEKEYYINFDPSHLILNKFINKVKRQLCYLFIINIIIMFWVLYYCTIFCYIYHHNQIDWFKGGWISFFISFLTTLIIGILIALLRFYSIKKKNKYLYYISIYLNRFFN